MPSAGDNAIGRVAATGGRGLFIGLLKAIGAGESGLVGEGDWAGVVVCGGVWWWCVVV